MRVFSDMAVLGLPSSDNWKAEKTRAKYRKERCFMLGTQTALALTVVPQQRSFKLQPLSQSLTRSTLCKKKPASEAKRIVARISDQRALMFPQTVPQLFAADVSCEWNERLVSSSEMLPPTLAAAEARKVAVSQTQNEFANFCKVSATRFVAERLSHPFRNVPANTFGEDVNGGAHHKGVRLVLLDHTTDAFTHEAKVMSSLHALDLSQAFHVPYAVRCAYRGCVVWCSTLHPTVCHTEPLSVFLKLSAKPTHAAAVFLSKATVSICSDGRAYVLDLSKEAFPYATVEEAGVEGPKAAVTLRPVFEEQPRIAASSAEHMREQMQRLRYPLESCAAWELLILHEGARRQSNTGKDVLSVHHVADVLHNLNMQHAALADVIALLEDYPEWIALRPCNDGNATRWLPADVLGVIRVAKTELVATAYSRLLAEWCCRLRSIASVDFNTLALNTLRGLVNYEAELHSFVWEGELCRTLREAFRTHLSLQEVPRKQLLTRTCQLVGVRLPPWWGASRGQNPSCLASLSPGDIELLVLVQRMWPDIDTAQSTQHSTANSAVLLGRECDSILSAATETFSSSSIALVPLLLNCAHLYAEQEQRAKRESHHWDMSRAELCWTRILSMHVEAFHPKSEDMMGFDLPLLKMDVAFAKGRVAVEHFMRRVVSVLLAVSAWCENVYDFARSKEVVDLVTQLRTLRAVDDNDVLEALRLRLRFLQDRKMHEAFTAFADIETHIINTHGRLSAEHILELHTKDRLFLTFRDTEKSVALHYSLAKELWESGRCEEAREELVACRTLVNALGSDKGEVTGCVLRDVVKVHFVLSYFEEAAEVVEELSLLLRRCSTTLVAASPIPEAERTQLTIFASELRHACMNVLSHKPPGSITHDLIPFAPLAPCCDQ